MKRWSNSLAFAMSLACSIGMFMLAARTPDSILFWTYLLFAGCNLFAAATNFMIAVEANVKTDH